jgi:virulence factor Mce-like protein
MSAGPAISPWRLRLRRARAGVVVTAVVVALLAVGAVIGWRETHGGTPLTAQFDATVGVYPGSDVRMLGVRVGSVTAVTPVGRGVDVTMQLDHGVRAAADTGAVIISPNLVGDRYVQLTRPYTTGAALPAGASIPMTRTATPVELDQLYSGLEQLARSLGPHGANAHGALTQLLRSTAANLHGNAAAMNHAISALAGASGTLSASRQHIGRTLSQLSRFTGMLQTNNGDLDRLNRELATVSGVLAADGPSFDRALNSLGHALTLVQSFVRANRSELTANVDKLSGVAQALVTERQSILQAARSAPLLVDNFVHAYDPHTNELMGRDDLNEVSIWAHRKGGAAPPTLLPSTSTPAGTP